MTFDGNHPGQVACRAVLNPEPTAPAVVREEMDAAEEALEGLVNHSIETLSIHSEDPSEARFLGQNISKLSPLIGNLIERRLVGLLAERDVEHNMRWLRQDPYFPDAVLAEASGSIIPAGFEVKAWYCPSTELTGRFRESVNLLDGKDIRLVIVAWLMDRIVFGQPLVLGVLVVDAESVARQRDTHYHVPPRYLIVEPEDTTERTANLQQSNVSGYRLQETDESAARRLFAASPYSSHEPHTPEAQALVDELMNSYRYRLDTNFAKVDRIDHPEIEAFKRRILGTTHAGRTVRQWITVLRSLSSTTSATRLRAEEVLAGVYDGNSSD